MIIKGTYKPSKHYSFQEVTDIIPSILEIAGYFISDEKSIMYGYQFKIDPSGVITLYQKQNILSSIIFSKVQSNACKILVDRFNLVNVTKENINTDKNNYEIGFKEYIGTDESGKGDLFGPIVIAGMCVNKETESILKKIKVKDCKANTDKLNLYMAQQIYDSIDKKYYSIISVPVKEFNNTFNKEENNTACSMAYMHGSAIKNISERTGCMNAVIDKFDNSPKLISRLKEVCPNVNIKLYPKAEKYLGVAAASIIARAEYLKNMSILSRKAGFPLHLGVSDLVKKDLIKLIKNNPDKLPEFCKMNFKTVSEVIDRNQNITD